MRFETKIFTIKNIKKKTAAKGFKDLKVGDKIRFYIELDHTAKGRGRGIYASEVVIFGPQDKWKNSQNVFINNISNFELE